MEYLSEGLDRADFKTYNHADRHLEMPLQGTRSDDSICGDHTEEQPCANPSKACRAADKFRHSIKSKTEQLFHHQPDSAPSTSPALPTLAPPSSSEADDDRMFHDAPEQKGPSFKEVLHNPVSTVQSALHGASGAKFAETMDNQVIAHGAEVRLVHAYDEVLAAGNEKDKADTMNNLEDLKKTRQDQFVRWTLDRHVLKVRRVPPRTTSLPRRHDFKVKDDHGLAKMQWMDFSHHVGSHSMISVM